MRSLLISALLVAGLATKAFADLNDVRFRGHTDNFRYEVQMRFKSARSTRHYPNAHKYWTVFDSLRVTLNDREIDAPKAVLDDLFWPHPSGSPYPGPGSTLRIPITGGSGEYSFEAVLVFSKSRFVQVERRDHATATWKITKYDRH